MNLKHLPYSDNVLDCAPYVAPAWADVLSSVSIILFCFTLIFMVFYYALASLTDYLFEKTSRECFNEYSDYSEDRERPKDSTYY